MEEKVFHAVLLDTVSIQEYVFGSNKLKENLGASSLLKDVLEGFLIRSLMEDPDMEVAEKNKESLDSWKSDKGKDKIRMLEEDGVSSEIGYIGGGNALIFFRNSGKDADFVKYLTRTLLVEAPGIKVAVGFHDFEINDEGNNFKNFKGDMEKLRKSLMRNKNMNHCQTVIPRHGFTAECGRTGLSNEIEGEEPNKFISSVSRARIDAAGTGKVKVKEIMGLNQEQYKNYDITDEIEKLGQKEGESHIAVVHIDGNGMGSRFDELESLAETREMSVKVADFVESSLREMTEDIIKRMGENEKDKEPFIPIRPIIIGGDDITFVCDGRLGIYFAEKFMKLFAEKENKISSCAGVAIVKTAYPFYRAYRLAEELCQNAKRTARELGEKNWNNEKNKWEIKMDSWLDFHISYGGFSGNLEDIRRQNYITPQGNLLVRPYRVYPAGDDKRNLENVKNAVKFFCGKLNDNENKEWPNSKLKELRSILTVGKESVQQFIAENEYRDRKIDKLRDYLEFNDDTLWKNNKTPFFDVLELMEFYPHELMAETNSEEKEKARV